MLQDFQQYQMEFARHIRDPKNTNRPNKVLKRRMAVYQEIVFNNVESTLSACFPVLQSVLGKLHWIKLVRDFFIHHSCQTPIFREIPEEFLSFLAQCEGLPEFVRSLAHYEWIELYVAYAPADLEAPVAETPDLLDGVIVFSPVNQVLAYDYPVQMISPKFKPKAKLEIPVYLIVFRNQQDQVKFLEVNSTTAYLIEQLQLKSVTARQLLTEMAEAMGAKDADAIIDFGHDTLKDLMRQELILGSRFS
jgi:uncharacterized protein